MEHFFAYTSRMRFISRWALMRNSQPENIQEHSHQVAVLAHALAVIRNRCFGGRVDPGTVAVAALAAYGLAKIRFPGRNFFFLLFLSAMMLPVEVLTVPTFLGLARFHLTDSHFALIVPQIFGMGGAFGIFMMRQYFITVPDELIEAAKIDGCAQPRIFGRIVLPMASSTIASLVIYTFFNAWNDYFLPLIYLNSSEKYTSTLALSLFSNEVGTTWNYVMAASVISTLPLLIVFFCAQKKFIESLAMSGIK